MVGIVDFVVFEFVVGTVAVKHANKCKYAKKELFKTRIHYSDFENSPLNRKNHVNFLMGIDKLQLYLKYIIFRDVCNSNLNFVKTFSELNIGLGKDDTGIFF